ncbi:MAG TPA: helix-turn-helix transcriptional regulator [Steroidobacteraceae bacterium]|nr:helix-turn-helix transcriptional regulator [Steroidobacteraceae bacterium]
MSSEQEFSGEQSRQIAVLIREEIARRRMSRQQLADKAKLSLSTLEKVLGGRRPLTLATAVRVEEALGVSLRRSAPDADAPLKDGIAPDGLGAYSRRGATWLEGVYVTVRPSFGEKGAIYAYRTEILWDEATSRLVFREAERLDAEFSQYGEVAVPNQSGHIYLVTNRHGQHRLITVSRPMISGEMYGVIATLLAGRGSMLTPIAAPIALLPVKNVPDAAYGRIAAGDARGALYREHLQRVTSEQFAMFLP